MRSQLQEAAEQFAAEYRRRKANAFARRRPPKDNANHACEAECANAACVVAGLGADEHGKGSDIVSLDAVALGAPIPESRTTLRSWLHQLQILLCREGLMITRNPADAAGRMGTCMYVAIIIGFVFLALSPEGTSYQSRLGCIFISIFALTELPFVSMGLIMSDSWLLVREAAEDLYRPSACFVARQIVNTVINAANAIVYTTTTYGLAGLRPGAGHIWTSNIIQVFGYLILIQVMAVGSVVMPTQDTAFMMAVASVATFILLANFLIRWQEITWGWVAALRFVSPMYFAFGSLVENEFANRSFPCPHELRAGVACVSDGNIIVDMYTDYSLGTTTGVMVGWWVGLMVLTYGAMLWRIKQLTGKWR